MSHYNNLAGDFGNMNLGHDGRRHDYYSGQRDQYPPPQPYPGDHTRPPADPYRSDHGGDYSSPPPPVPGPRPGDYAPRPSPPYTPPSDKPPIPSGWNPHWDEPHQRWYYVESATGKSQWEAPGYFAASRDAMTSPPGGGYGGHGAPGYGGYSSQPPPQEKRGHGGVLLGAAGGLAVGAIGGALLANAFDDDDDHHHAAQQQYAPPPAPPSSYYPPPQDPGVPLYNADGEYISGSDRESVEEAREAYLEALDDARSSSASSSEREELEEARREYEEEYAEAYYDD